MSAVVDRTALFLMSKLTIHLWGFVPNLIPMIVEQHGGLAALRWFVGNMPRYERVLRDFGPIRTHLLVSAISATNGCPYCFKGHWLAFELHYFKAHGKLFPLNEDFFTLGQRDPEKFRSMLAASLVTSGLPAEVAHLNRLWALMEQGQDAPPASADDRRILALIDVFRFLNACGIRGKTLADRAHDPIAKDAELEARFQVERRKLRMTSEESGMDTKDPS
jgi:hypothetical protein